MESISRQELIEMIKEEHLRRYGKRGRITLSSFYDFELVGGILYMKIHQVTTNLEEDANMQSDKGAFDAWAVGIKSWIDEVDKVVLRWDKPEDVNEPHYQRFLYRLLKSMEIFDWLVPDNNCAGFLDDLRLKIGSGENYIINAPDQEAQENASGLEARTEREFVANFNKQLAGKVGMDNDNIFNQLPVGVFKDSRKTSDRILPRSGAQIDLWGINKAKKELHLFELKAKDSKKKSGIYSQLFFYSILQQDIISNQIERADKSSSNNHRGYHELHDSEITSILM